MTRRPTPEELRELLDQAAITQAKLAKLCHASLRTMQQWLAPSGCPSSRRIPRASSELMCIALVAHRYISPGPWLDEFVRPEFRPVMVAGAVPSFVVGPKG